MPFIIIDTLGGVFSILSLVFKVKFDPFAGVAYGLVVVSVIACLFHNQNELDRFRNRSWTVL